MKPGNLLIQGAKSGGRRKMRIRYSTRRIFDVCIFDFQTPKGNRKTWKKDFLPPNA